MFGEIYHKRMGDGVREHSSNPHRKLWLTVITMAVMDCLMGAGQDKIPVVWFYTADCRFLCDLAGIEQDALIKRVRELTNAK